MSVARFGLRTRSGQVSGLIQGIPAFDPDALAFINAAGIIDATQAGAIEKLVTDLKNYGLWTKMKAIYPFVGGTATSHKFNLKNPLDTNAAFRLTFSGGWTHSSTGAKPNGSNGYADTFYNLSTNSTTSNISAGVYIRVGGVSAGYEFGGLDNNYNGLAVSLSATDGNTYYCANNFILNGSGGTGILLGNGGLFVIIKETISLQKMFRNGTLNRQSATTGNTAPNVNVLLGARRVGVGIEQYNAREHAFTYFGDTLTATEITNLYTTVQAYQTTLNRQV